MTEVKVEKLPDATLEQLLARASTHAQPSDDAFDREIVELVDAWQDKENMDLVATIRFGEQLQKIGLRMYLKKPFDPLVQTLPKEYQRYLINEIESVRPLVPTQSPAIPLASCLTTVSGIAPVLAHVTFTDNSNLPTNLNRLTGLKPLAPKLSQPSLSKAAELVRLSKDDDAQKELAFKSWVRRVAGEPWHKQAVNKFKQEHRHLKVKQFETLPFIDPETKDRTHTRETKWAWEFLVAAHEFLLTGLRELQDTTDPTERSVLRIASTCFTLLENAKKLQKNRLHAYIGTCVPSIVLREMGSETWIRKEAGLEGPVQIDRIFLDILCYKGYYANSLTQKKDERSNRQMLDYYWLFPSLTLSTKEVFNEFRGLALVPEALYDQGSSLPLLDDLRERAMYWLAYNKERRTPNPTKQLVCPDRLRNFEHYLVLILRKMSFFTATDNDSRRKAERGSFDLMKYKMNDISATATLPDDLDLGKWDKYPEETKQKWREAVVRCRDEVRTEIEKVQAYLAKPEKDDAFVSTLSPSTRSFLGRMHNGNDKHNSPLAVYLSHWRKLDLALLWDKDNEDSMLTAWNMFRDRELLLAFRAVQTVQLRHVLALYLNQPNKQETFHRKESQRYALWDAAVCFPSDHGIQDFLAYQQTVATLLSENVVAYLQRRRSAGYLTSCCSFVLLCRYVAMYSMKALATSIVNSLVTCPELATVNVDQFFRKFVESDLRGFKDAVVSILASYRELGIHDNTLIRLAELKNLIVTKKNEYAPREDTAVQRKPKEKKEKTDIGKNDRPDVEEKTRSLVSRLDPNQPDDSWRRPKVAYASTEDWEYFRKNGDKSKYGSITTQDDTPLLNQAIQEEFKVFTETKPLLVSAKPARLIKRNDNYAARHAQQQRGDVIAAHCFDHLLALLGVLAPRARDKHETEVSMEAVRATLLFAYYSAVVIEQNLVPRLQSISTVAMHAFHTTEAKHKESFDDCQRLMKALWHEHIALASEEGLKLMHVSQDSEQKAVWESVVYASTKAAWIDPGMFVRASTLHESNNIANEIHGEIYRLADTSQSFWSSSDPLLAKKKD